MRNNGALRTKPKSKIKSKGKIAQNLNSPDLKKQLKTSTEDGAQGEIWTLDNPVFSRALSQSELPGHGSDRFEA